MDRQASRFWPAAGACLAALLAATPASALTVIYDASADFSDSQNPNGVWSYLQGSTPMGHFIGNAANPMDLAYGNGYWGTGTNLWFSTPEIGKVTLDGSAVPSFNDADFLAGDIVVHSTNPGMGAPVAVEWTAPSAGTASVDIVAWYAHSNVVRANDVTVLLNGVSIGSGVLTPTDNRLAPLSFQFAALEVAAGDVLRLQFTPSAGQGVGSLAGFSESVTLTSAVPEPAAALLFATGLLGLALRSHRRA